MKKKESVEKATKAQKNSFSRGSSRHARRACAPARGAWTKLFEKQFSCAFVSSRLIQQSQKCIFQRSQKYVKIGSRGFTLVESLVSIAVFAVIVSFVAPFLSESQESQIRFSQKNRAEALISESIEAVSSIRNQNFLSLQNGDHGLQMNQGVFSFSGNSDLVDAGFTRKIVIADVFRDPATNTIADQGIHDPRTKKVTVQISWNSDVEGQKILSQIAYFSDWYARDLIMSSISDWSQGTHDHTKLSLLGNGALLLDEQPISWENQVHESSQIFQSNQNANANAFTVSGNIGYLVSDYQGGFDNFITLNVSNPSQVRNVGSRALGESVSGLAVVINSSKAYVGTNHGNKELLIVDISDPAHPVLQGEVNLPRNTMIQSLALSGSTLFAGTRENGGREFYIFDLTDPVSPIQRGSVELGHHVEDIVVLGSTAYLAVDDDDHAFVILDISNPSNIRVLSRVRAQDHGHGKALAKKEKLLYFLSREGIVEVFDVRNPALPTRLGMLDLHAASSDLEVYGSWAFLVTSKTNEEFQIFDISNPSTLRLRNTVDLHGTGNTIFSNANAVFVTSDNNTSPLTIYSSPVQIFSEQGTFTSSIFNTGLSHPIWQTISFQAVIPGTTTVRFQLRTGDTEAHLRETPFTGSDGTSGTYYTLSSSMIQLPANTTGTQYLQYRVLMTSQGRIASPEITSIRFQYLP